MSDEEKIKLLRSALIGLVGTSDLAELDAVECAIRAAPAPDKDKAALINAFDAIRQTA